MTSKTPDEFAPEEIKTDRSSRYTADIAQEERIADMRRALRDHDNSLKAGRESFAKLDDRIDAVQADLARTRNEWIERAGQAKVEQLEKDAARDAAYRAELKRVEDGSNPRLWRVLPSIVSVLLIAAGALWWQANIPKAEEIRDMELRLRTLNDQVVELRAKVGALGAKP